MDVKFSYLFFILLMFSVTIYNCYGIKCWHCNSYLDPHCSDPFDNSTANSKDCSIEPELPAMRGVPATMCRKIRMKVYGQWRFKRDCARLGEPGIGGDERYCIYRTGTYNIHMEYCTCNDKDGCNAATSKSIHFLTLLAGISLIVGSLYISLRP